MSSESAGSPDTSEDLGQVALLRSELEQAQRAQKIAEEELRETLAAMIQHQQVGKCGNFRYSTVTGAITGTEEVFKIFAFPVGTRGCTAEEWLEKIHPDDRGRIATEFYELVGSRQDLRFEYRITVAGQVKHIRCDGELDLAFKGDPTYFGVLTDITERRAALEAQRAMEAELASALRLASMGELAGSIIHEVNQPLAAISASAEACRRWMISGPGGIERALASLERVVEEGRRAAAIMSGLKSLIHNVPTGPTPFDFDAATREVCALLRAELAREDVLLEALLEPNLPFVAGDRVQIQQIMVNLARNAIEAMRDCGRRKVLSVRTARRDQFVQLTVTDTGPGIAAEEPERLFAPLYTTKAGGMGLGLSISRRIAIAHSGSLEAEAGKDGGAAFHLLLPAEVGVNG